MIEKLSHYSSIGPYWSPIDEATTAATIERATKFTGQSPAQIQQRLAAGEEVECSATTCDDGPRDLIRDSEIAEARQIERDNAMYQAEQARRKTSRKCKICGEPATMAASMGPACDEHYDDLSN